MKKLQAPHVPKIPLKRIIYPLMSAVYLVVVVVLVISATRFLSTNINATFKLSPTDVESQLPHLDLDSYRSVAKKLGLPPPP